MSSEMVGTGVLHGVTTAALLFSFVAMWLWAYSAGRRPAPAELAYLPVEGGK